MVQKKTGDLLGRSAGQASSLEARTKTRQEFLIENVKVRRQVRKDLKDLSQRGENRTLRFSELFAFFKGKHAAR